jgi:hypothetical protein
VTPLRKRRLGGNYSMATNCAACQNFDDEAMLTCCVCYKMFHEQERCSKDAIATAGDLEWKCMPCRRPLSQKVVERNNVYRVPGNKEGGDQNDPQGASSVAAQEFAELQDRHEAQTRVVSELTQRLKEMEDRFAQFNVAASSSEHKNDDVINPLSDEEDEEEKAGRKRLTEQFSRLRHTSATSPTKLVIPDIDKLDANNALEFIKNLSAALPQIIEKFPGEPKKEIPPRPSSAPVNSSTESPFCQLVAAMNRQYVAELPRFSGEIKEWAHFEATFRGTSKKACRKSVVVPCLCDCHYENLATSIRRQTSSNRKVVQRTCEGIFVNLVRHRHRVREFFHRFGHLLRNDSVIWKFNWRLDFRASAE